MRPTENFDAGWLIPSNGGRTSQKDVFKIKGKLRCETIMNTSVKWGLRLESARRAAKLLGSVMAINICEKITGQMLFVPLKDNV